MKGTKQPSAGAPALTTSQSIRRKEWDRAYTHATFRAWIYDYIVQQLKESTERLRAMAYLEDEYNYGRTNNAPPAGYIRTRPPMTKPAWATLTRPKFMSSYGLEKLNTRVLYQDQIWIDKTGTVWTINGRSSGTALVDDHLDRIIAWLEYGRDWLADSRGVSVTNSIMYRGLIAERARRVKEQEENGSAAGLGKRASAILYSTRGWTETQLFTQLRNAINDDEFNSPREIRDWLTNHGYELHRMMPTDLVAKLKERHGK